MSDENSSYSLLDIISLAKGYLTELRRKFWVVLLCMVILGGYLYTRKSKDPIIYTGSLSFMLNEKADMSRSMLEGLLSSGLGNSGEYSSNNMDLQKMEELITSRNIIQKVLFSRQKMTLRWGTPKEDFLINHYLHEFWYGGAAEGAYFQHDSTEILNKDEGARLQSVYRAIIRGQLKKYATPAEIMNISFESTNEEFSYVFVNVLFSVLDRYYMENTLEKQREILRAARWRVDSLEREMSKAESNYFNYLNQHNAYTRQNVAITQQRLQRRLAAETETYLLSFKNQEMAAIALEQQEKFPILRKLDPPMYPLPTTVPNPMLHLIIGTFLGAIMGIGFVVARKLWVDMIAKEKAKKQQSQPPSAA